MAAEQGDKPMAPGTRVDQGYYTRYVPLWSTADPFTGDSGRRPATEPWDQVKNPTEYALYVQLFEYSGERQDS